MRAVNEKYVDLGRPRRVWAIGSIQGDLERLIALHDHLATRFSVRDRLVYLGNYLSPSSRNNQAVINELLAFRAALLAKPGMEPTDIVHLRGPAEEAWQRLLRLQFAPVPLQAMERLQEAGVDSYLQMYNISVNDTKVIARAGSIAITRWTNQLRDMQRKSAGHEALMSSTRRAAFTQPSESDSKRMLFVPAGFEASRSLEDQGEALWNGYVPFKANEGSPYSRIIRGFDATRMGIQTQGVAVTLDGGCGFGGPLACGCFDAAGTLLEVVTVGGPSVVESLSAPTASTLFGDIFPPSGSDTAQALFKVEDGIIAISA